MDITEAEVQFRCKLCQFTGTDKNEIAEHFLSEHIEVEYISPAKKQQKDEPGREKENEDTGSTAKKSSSRKRGRPKGKTLLQVKMPKKELKITVSPEKATSSSEPEIFGRGKRKRKKKISVDVVDSEDMIELDDLGDEGHAYDSFVVEDAAHEEPTEEQDLNDAKKMKSEIEPINFTARRRGRPTKAEQAARRNKDRNWSAVDNAKTKRERGGNLNLKVPMKVFRKIVSDRVDDWQKTYEEKNSMDMFYCEVERCRGIEMPEAEFDVHRKCHVLNMEGFRCFICHFMCLHWRNMRHHYRKVHDEMLTKVTCDFADCHKEFPKSCVLRCHVTKAHIQPLIASKLNARSTDDLSEFSNYIDNVKLKKEEEKHDPTLTVEHDLDDEPRKRGRPRKRPVGRPPKEPSKPKHPRRLHGEDREKFQRRLVAFVCEVCNAKFNEEELMIQHNTKHYHDESGQIHCTECETFVTSDEESLRFHMLEEHKRMLQLHRCEKCNFSSNRFHDLKKHAIVHTGAKDYMCHKCGKCTTTPYNLKVHYRRMHASDDEKNIKCFACDYMCADKAVLKDHIRQKHGLLVNGDEYTNPRSLLVFTCPHCPYVGRKQSSLDYHMRIHNENRQFKCHLCPYASKTKNNLVLHLRTHEGLRPVKCPHCDFRGATNKIISEHVMCKHANVRPYHCNICGWSTAYSGNMWKHVDTHQKELGDKMPEFPVNVVSSDKHAVPTPLRAPSGKKRRIGKALNFKLKVAKTRKMRQQHQQPTPKVRPLEEQTATISILDGRDSNVQTIQVQTGGNLPEGVLMHVPVHTVLGANGQMMVAKGLPQEEAVGSTALSRLAAAVASSQEVHIIRTDDGLQGGDVQQEEHRIISTTLPDGIPTSIHVDASNGIEQEIIEYAIPNVSQHIVTSDITEVITSDHHYHASAQHINDHQQMQHHHQHQQQQQQGGNSSSIQQAAMHAGIPTNNANAEQVPTAIVEQIVHDTPQGGDDQTVVHNLVASMIPHDAELVMSMMQIQQVPDVQQVQQIQHVQQPNVSH